jgi:hypothetical protein
LKREIQNCWTSTRNHLEIFAERGLRSLAVKIQGVPLTRNEDSKQALDNNSDLLKYHPDQILSLQEGIQGNGFKGAQLSDKAGMVGAYMSIKRESLAGTKMSTEPENNQGSDCKNMVLG